MLEFQSQLDMDLFEWQSGDAFGTLFYLDRLHYDMHWIYNKWKVITCLRRMNEKKFEISYIFNYQTSKIGSFIWLSLLIFYFSSFLILNLFIYY